MSTPTVHTVATRPMSWPQSGASQLPAASAMISIGGQTHGVNMAGRPGSPAGLGLRVESVMAGVYAITRWRDLHHLIERLQCTEDQR
jgi:hypothetical protein